MGSLFVIALGACGQHASYFYVNAAGLTDMTAVLSVDRERRYFIATASTAAPDAACDRVRYRMRVNLSLLGLCVGTRGFCTRVPRGRPPCARRRNSARTSPRR